MKNLYRIVILFILVVTLNVKTNAQTCVLGLYDNFGPVTCGNHCWARAVKNIISYYGISVNNLEIIDYARSLGGFNCMCIDCYISPDSCCKILSPNLFDELLLNWGIASDLNWTYNNATCLYNNFIFNKPVIIITTGHAFVAHGISGNNVYVVDGEENYIRDINDICPGRTWESTFAMNNNRNCLLYNHISNNLSIGQTFTSDHTITVSNGVFYHYDQTTTLQAENNVQLCSGLTIRNNCSVIIQTGYNFCQ